MADSIELSSDSNDTIIVPIKENSENFYDLSEFDDKDTHYENVNVIGKSKTQNTLEIFDTDAEGDNLFNQIPDDSEIPRDSSNINVANDLLKELFAKYLPSENNQKGTLVDNPGDKKQLLKRKVSNEMNETETVESKKSTKKQMLELERNKRKLEQHKKKELLEEEKALKKALKTVQKSINPDECLKNIIVKVDETLICEYGESIIEELRTNNISYKSVKHVCNGVISWIRKVQTIENLVCKLPTSNEKHYLLVLPSTEFKSLVKNHNLNTHIHSVSLKLKFQHLTIAVFGLNKPSDDQEYAVMETEMFFKCYWQFVNKVEDLSSLVFMLTKAVAQIPYKLEKQEKYKLQNEFFADSNKDTVRVDKNGNGLSRLWNQMLTMLPLARLETAEAITFVYPTLSSLFNAYEECEADKAELLQNLQIRRANGPLATARKIGPELSKKCANFFTSTDNVFI